MAVLSKDELKRLILYEKDINKKIIITPILNEKQIGEGTIDIRLGTRFIVFRRRKIPILDPNENEIDAKIEKDYQERVYCRFGDRFILHPGELVLGCSLEYFRLPANIFGYVTGRSSWGRLGLVVEAAPVIHPCFSGVITFELANIGQAPIALYVGSRIAQVSFHLVENVDDNVDCLLKRSKYHLSLEPEFSKIHEDVEFKNKWFK